MRLYLDDAFFTAGLRRAAGVRHRLRPAVPAAGLLLRDVRAGRPGAQRPRPLRPDDVGADRQQRDLRARCCSPTCSRTAPRRATSSCGGYTPGQELLLGLGSTARHRRPARCPAALPARRRRSATGRASTSAAPAWATPSGWASGPLGFVRRQPDRLHRRRAAGLQRHGRRGRPACGGGGGEAGTGYTIYSGAFLLVMVPHSIATVSLATAALPAAVPARRGRRPARRWPRQVAATTRTALALILPFALLLPADRAAAVRHRVGLRRGRRDLRRLRGLARALRARPGLLHRPLPDAARLLRPGAHPHRLLGPVRHRRDQHRARGRRSPRVTAPPTPRPGLVARLRRGVRRRRAGRPTSCCAACWAALETPETVRFAGPDAASPPALARRVRRAAARRRCSSSGSSATARCRRWSLLAAAPALVDLVVLLVLARAMRITEVTEVVSLVTQPAPTPTCAPAGPRRAVPWQVDQGGELHRYDGAGPSRACDGSRVAQNAIGRGAWSPPGSASRTCWTSTPAPGSGVPPT